MGVSENRGTPKSSISIAVFHSFHHPFLGYLYFWKKKHINHKPKTQRAFSEIPTISWPMTKFDPLGVSPTKGFCWLRKKHKHPRAEALDVRHQLGSFHLKKGWKLWISWIFFPAWWQELYTTDLFFWEGKKITTFCQKKQYLFWYLFPPKNIGIVF